MHVFLAGLSVVYVLTTPKIVAHDNETIANTGARMKWEEDDYIYQSKPRDKDVWDTLEAKYLLEDVTSKKFLVSKFMNYKMVDTRPIVEQFNENLHILNQFG
jgi:hypothetical protein